MGSRTIGVITKVLISNIEGKTVALYFCCSSDKASQRFTPNLVEMYNKLKGLGKNFEAVLISLDKDEQAYKEDLKTIPFLAMPFIDSICQKLHDYFGVFTLPTLVIIGPDGKTLNTDVVELVKDYGIQAYPFTPKRLEELADIERRRLELQTLESLLVSGERDFVINKDGAKAWNVAFEKQHCDKPNQRYLRKSVICLSEYGTLLEDILSISRNFDETICSGEWSGERSPCPPINGQHTLSLSLCSSFFPQRPQSKHLPLYWLKP